MNQQKLEKTGLGFRCVGCGMSVFASSPVTEATPRLCTACQQDKDDPAGWVKRRTVPPTNH